MSENISLLTIVSGRRWINVSSIRCVLERNITINEFPQAPTTNSNVIPSSESFARNCSLRSDVTVISFEVSLYSETYHVKNRFGTVTRLNILL